MAYLAWCWYTCAMWIYSTLLYQKMSHGFICLNRVQFTCEPPVDRLAGSQTAAITGGTLLFSSVVQVLHPPSWSRTYGDGPSNLHSVYVILKLSCTVSSLPRFVTDHTSPKTAHQTVPKPPPTFPEAPNSFSSPSHRNIQCQCINQCLGIILPGLLLKN